MNPEPLVAWFKNFGGALTKALTPTQLLSLLLTFGAVVGLIVGAAYWVTTPTYGVLFSGLDPESAASVVEDLQASQVDYRLDAGGRTVRVPGPQLDELRLHFASQGLPASGRIGFEIFDRTAFGATEFLEQVNLRRALEGEIARTITSLAEIDGARVHIALAPRAVFGRTPVPASASVVLRLRHRAALPEATVRGVSNLVAAGVEGLQPEGVVLMDSFGRLLHPTEAATGGAASQAGRTAARRRALEDDLTTRVVALLEPVVGVGRVRANVAVVLQTSSEEATEESWDPTTAVARSRQVTGDPAFLTAAAEGLAGARANLPPRPPPPSGGDAPAGTDATTDATPPDADADAAPVPAPAPPAAPPAPGQGSATTNYEISKSVRHVVRPAGDIARLSVAVILDDRLVPAADATTGPRLEPRAPADVEKVRGLVAAALGVDPARGDLLTVENIPFETPPVEPWVAPAVWESYLPQIMEAVRIGAALLLVLALLQFALRPLIRRVTAVSAAGAGALHIDGTPALGTVSQQGKIEAMSTHATTLTHREPETAARLVRAWLEEEKDR